MISVSLDVGSSSKSRPQNEQAQRPKPQNCLGGAIGGRDGCWRTGMCSGSAKWSSRWCIDRSRTDDDIPWKMQMHIGGIPQKMQNRWWYPHPTFTLNTPILWSRTCDFIPISAMVSFGVLNIWTGDGWFYHLFFFRMETGPLIDLWWFISFKWSFSIAKLNHHRLSLNFRLGGDQLQHLKPWGLPWFPQVQLHLSSSFGAAFIASVPGNVRAGWFRNTVGNWHHSGSVMGILEIFGNEVVGECWG